MLQWMNERWLDRNMWWWLSVVAPTLFGLSLLVGGAYTSTQRVNACLESCDGRGVLLEAHGSGVNVCACIGRDGTFRAVDDGRP